jgi:hypothetical protein
VCQQCANCLESPHIMFAPLRRVSAAFVLPLLCLTACSTFTVNADLSEQVAGRWSETLVNAQGTRTDLTHQPIARVALGFEPELSRTLTATVGVEHRSFPFTNADRGEERAYVGLRWQPWKRP